MKNYLLLFIVLFCLSKTANAKSIGIYPNLLSASSEESINPFTGSPNYLIPEKSELKSSEDTGSRETDSLALVALYNQNGGESWTNKENWLTGPLNTWENITVEDGRVTALKLSNNNLSGEITSEIGSLTKLEHLSIPGNNLTGTVPESIKNLTSLRVINMSKNNLSGTFPSISNLNDLLYLYLPDNNFTDLLFFPDSLESIKYISLKNNYLSFEDLEPIMSYAPSFSIFTYHPQKTKDEDTTIVVGVGQPLQLDFLLGGSQNKYVWYRNDIKIDSAGHSLFFENADTSTVGDYYCEATSELVPDLSIRSRTFSVFVEYPANPVDSMALVALYNQNGGENWKAKGNWLSGPMKTWENVTVEFGRVVELKLMNNRLSGEWCAELTNLTELKKLNLSINDISGSIPSDIDKLTKLEELNLSWTDMTGEIPTAITNLSQLRNLNLSNNQFSGEIPANIGLLNQLENLNLFKTNLTGEIPAEIGNLTNLKFLDLSGNDLSGTVPPTINNLTSLNNMDLSSNNLNGTFPDISDISNLLTLDIGNNNFSDISSLSESLDQLKYVFLPNNYLDFEDLEPLMDKASSLYAFQYSPQKTAGKDTSILLLPEEPLQLEFFVGGSQNKYIWYRDDIKIDSTGYSLIINNADTSTSGVYRCEVTNNLVPDLTFKSGNFTVFVRYPANTTDSLALVALYNQNGGETWKAKENWLSGPLDTWENVTVENGRVTELNLKSNNLSGEWCPELDNLSKLKTLNLASNDISGSLPAEIHQLTELETLDLSWNELEGTIPGEITNLKNLNSLNLNQNDFSGELPANIDNLTQLEYLDLSWNKLSGTIPENIGNLSNLYSLKLNANDLSGEIPETIGNLTNLKELSLSSNDLHGPIPNSINNLLFLSRLELAFNQLSGNFPDISNLTNLYYLKLDENELTGIPHLPESLESIRILYLQYNYLSFADLEPLMEESFSIFRYSPQRTYDKDSSVVVYSGDPLKLVFPTGGTQTNYVWYKDNNQLDISNSVLYIENTDLSHEGVYYCEATNDLVSNLTLSSWKFNVSVHFRANTTDSLALVALYNQCGGENWTAQENWLTGPMNTWENVTTQNGRVTELNLKNVGLSGKLCPELSDLTALQVLDLSENYLTGDLPDDMNNLTELKFLDISGNELTGLSNLSSVTGLTNLFVSDNYLTFEDLEPLMGQVSSMDNLVYAPQKTPEDTTINVVIGKTLNLDFSIGGSQNTYTWYKDDALLDNPYRSLVVETAVETDAGTYYCEVSNDLVPDLTIRSRKYIVTVSPDTYVSSIEEYGIRIAPNPSTGRFTLYNIQEIREIAIFNIKGEQIFFTQNSDGSEKITIHLNHKGLFILHLKTVSGVILTDKIVVR
ncbi:leucine-rich repeat domain-containing protein [Thermophagus sp. OGC60D27]|uniref:leucine-rich repeat domain-containing protein n=1 Tax=Thermophagus sp. OGC60D27 TaxID=3458415 RepID=UPI004037A40B